MRLVIAARVADPVADELRVAPRDAAQATAGALPTDHTRAPLALGDALAAHTLAA
jgi:hypothetical protein